MQLVAQGYGNPEIAEILSLSEWALLVFLNQIFNKLELSDRLELMLYGIVHGFIAPAAAGMSAEARGERTPAAA